MFVTSTTIVQLDSLVHLGDRDYNYEAVRLLSGMYFIYKITFCMSCADQWTHDRWKRADWVKVLLVANDVPG